MTNSPIIIRDLHQRSYQTTWDAMREFVDDPIMRTDDEIWLVEHLPTFTLGQNGKEEHILNESDIPIIQSDRGGQVTYHGPGQLIAYILLDLKKRGFGIRQMVARIEDAIINMLSTWDIIADRRQGAPGVYVQGDKVASLGLRVRKGWTYHGLSLNVNMDLTPFSLINPCGIPDLNMTQLSDLGGPSQMAQVKPVLVKHLTETLEYPQAINL